MSKGLVAFGASSGSVRQCGALLRSAGRMASLRSYAMLSVVAIVVSSLLLGCNSADTSDVEPLRSSVIFAIEEQEGEADLLMWTTEVFPCLNYSLRTDFRQAGHQVEVKIKGVVPPATCIKKEGPARYAHSLGSLSGTYDFVVRSQRQTDRYCIRAGRGGIEVNPLQQTFTDYWE